jgi:hypothetical protein
MENVDQYARVAKQHMSRIDDEIDEGGGVAGVHLSDLFWMIQPFARSPAPGPCI